MTIYRLPETACPVCHAKQDAVTQVSGEGPPQPGDLTVCAYCAVPLVFMDGSNVRLMTKQEFKELPEDQLNELILTVAFVTSQNPSTRRLQ